MRPTYLQAASHGQQSLVLPAAAGARWYLRRHGGAQAGGEGDALILDHGGSWSGPATCLCALEAVTAVAGGGAWWIVRGVRDRRAAEVVGSVVCRGLWTMAPAGRSRGRTPVQGRWVLGVGALESGVREAETGTVTVMRLARGCWKRTALRMWSVWPACLEVRRDAQGASGKWGPARKWKRQTKGDSATAGALCGRARAICIRQETLVTSFT